MREPHEPIDEPLEQLSDLALAWLGDLTLRGDTPLRQKAPRLIDWLGSEACREQARRRGEAVGAAPDFDLGAWTTPELLGAGEGAAFMALAARNVGFERDERATVEETHAILETLGIWAAIAEAVRRQLALTEAVKAQTVH